METSWEFRRATADPAPPVSEQLPAPPATILAVQGAIARSGDTRSAADYGDLVAPPKDTLRLARHADDRSAYAAPASRRDPLLAGNLGSASQWVSYQAPLSLTVVSPLTEPDGHDFPGLLDEAVPSLATGFDDLVVVTESAVREPCLAHVLPDVFDRVQFW